MNIGGRLVSGLCRVLAIAFTLGPSVAVAVAPGYADWTGLERKNWLMGRVLHPSDLRQRVAIVIELEVDEKDESMTKLGDELRLMVRLAMRGTYPQWDYIWDTTDEIPRKCLVVVSIKGKCTPKMIAKAVSPRASEGDTCEASYWLAMPISFYSKCTMSDEPNKEGKYPYVYVMGPNGTEPLWKGLCTKEKLTEICKTADKAIRELGAWVPMTGVEEPKFFLKERDEIRQDKALKGVLTKLQKAFSDSNQEKAKEAQVMYDAVMQYRSELIFRIIQEHKVAPARAYVDMQRLFAMFPQDKKEMQEIVAKLNSNKSTAKIGKIFEKYMMWNQPDFVFKNVSEAKKAVQLVKTWRKPLEKVSNDQEDAGLSGEASLILSQLDGLNDVLMSKVPSK